MNIILSHLILKTVLSFALCLWNQDGSPSALLEPSTKMQAGSHSFHSVVWSGNMASVIPAAASYHYAQDIGFITLDESTSLEWIIPHNSCCLDMACKKKKKRKKASVKKQNNPFIAFWNRCVLLSYIAQPVGEDRMVFQKERLIKPRSGIQTHLFQLVQSMLFPCHHSAFPIQNWERFCVYRINRLNMRRRCRQHPYISAILVTSIEGLMW